MKVDKVQHSFTKALAQSLNLCTN